MVCTNTRRERINFVLLLTTLSSIQHSNSSLDRFRWPLSLAFKQHQVALCYTTYSLSHLVYFFSSHFCGGYILPLSSLREYIQPLFQWLFRGKGGLEILLFLISIMTTYTLSSLLYSPFLLQTLLYRVCLIFLLHFCKILFSIQPLLYYSYEQTAENLKLMQAWINVKIVAQSSHFLVSRSAEGFDFNIY